jgi:hypothetical protein
MADHRKRTFELMNRVHKRDLDLVHEFFFVFSRFEYALLSTCYPGKGNGGVRPDWDKFARDHDQAFTDLTDQEQKAVRYYEESPPKKQAIESGILVWKEAPPQDKEPLVRLLILVRRVRNNLFHGPKFNALVGGESKGDTNLLEHGVTILHACLRISSDISDKFYSETKWELDNSQEEETEDD